MTVIVGAIGKVKVAGPIRDPACDLPRGKEAHLRPLWQGANLGFAVSEDTAPCKPQAYTTNGSIPPTGNFCLPAKQDRNVSNC